MTHPLVAPVALALGAALVLGAVTEPAVLLAAVVLAQGLVVAGWHRSLAVPGARGGLVVAAVAALASDGLVLADAGDRPLSAVPGVLALAVLAGLVHQLARRDGRDRLNASLTATVSLAALATLGSIFLAVQDAEGGVALVGAAAVPAALVVAGRVARQGLRGPGWADLAVMTAATAGAASAVVALGGLSPVPALAVAGTSAVVALAAAVLASRSAAPDIGVGAALPVVLAGPVAYVLGRLLVG